MFIRTTPAHGHKTSQLGLLPPEIRLQIFGILCNEPAEIHIFERYQNGGVRGSLCHSGLSQKERWESSCGCFANAFPKVRSRGLPNIYLTAASKKKASKHTVVDLMLTCAQLYVLVSTRSVHAMTLLTSPSSEEVTNLLYTTSTFTFPTPEDFLLFVHALPNNLINLIRHIHIDSRYVRVSYEQPLTALPQRIQIAHPHVMETPDNGAPFPRKPSTWGAAWHQISFMRSLRSVRVSLQAGRFSCLDGYLYDADVGGMYCHTAGDESFVIYPIRKAKKTLGDGVEFDVQIDWLPPQRGQGDGKYEDLDFKRVGWSRDEKGTWRHKDDEDEELVQRREERRVERMFEI